MSRTSLLDAELSAPVGSSAKRIFGSFIRNVIGEIKGSNFYLRILSGDVEIAIFFTFQVEGLVILIK